MCIRDSYKPKKLVFVRLHHQTKRYLLAASIFLAIVTFGVIGSNEIKSNKIKKTNQQMNQTLLDGSANIEKLQSWFNAHQSSPMKMESVVSTARKLTAGNPLPQHIFKVISGGYENFNDLSLNTLEWKTVLASINNTQTPNHQEALNTEESTPSNTILVTLEGEVLNFHGNYRHAIERIQAFVRNLKSLDPVTSITIHKLPLDINPTTKISRSIADQTAPSYALDVELHAGAL